jgi:glucokinase
MKYGFGIDIGGTTVKVAFFDENGEMKCKWEIPTRSEGGGEQILPDIAATVETFLQQNRLSKDSILGIGVGVPGPVSREGVVNKCVNLGWGVFNIEQELSQLTGLPVKAGNDANVAALGEYWMGGGQGYESLVMATLGTGVGGGIILDGKILYGARGAAGEIGHMVLDRNETEPCGCGKLGCAEQYCSATGVVRMAKRYMATDDRPSMLRGREITCKEIFDAAAAGDAVAAAALETVYARMAEFCANLANAFDPAVIVLGGGVSKAGEVLVEGIKRHFPKYVFHAMADMPFVLATLGNDAGAYGAFKLILDAYA